MNESAKWRSGRATVRWSATGPSRRGGKSADLLADDERVAAERDRYVMVPTGEPAPLEVIQSQFSFEILVGALGAVTLFDDADHFLP